MKAPEYWQKRAEARMSRGMASADGVLSKLERAYAKASREVESEIRRLYERYADEYGFSYADAIKDIEQSAYKEWRMTLADYVERINATGNTELLRELNTLSTRARVTRLQTLEAAVKVNASELAAKGEELVTQLLSDAYTGTYYRAAYDFQRGVGFGSSLEMLSTEQVARAISYPWSGSDYSKRIWKNADALTSVLTETITQGLIQGKDIRQMTAAVREATGTGLYNAQRLVRTETAYAVESAELKGYTDSGVDQYEVLVSLDERTCKKCGARDGEVHATADAKTSVNYPPFHAMCRCTTLAHFSDEQLAEWEKLGEEYTGAQDGPSERFARGADGKGVMLPGDITYTKWYDTYVQPLPKILKAPNAFLNKQLGFKDEAGIVQFIPRGAEIIQVHVIAGKGTAKDFRASASFAEQLGGQAAEWAKKVGKVESARYIFDVHWADLGGEMYDAKIKSRKERAK